MIDNLIILLLHIMSTLKFYAFNLNGLILSIVNLFQNNLSFETPSGDTTIGAITEERDIECITNCAFPSVNITWLLDGQPTQAKPVGISVLITQQSYHKHNARVIISMITWSDLLSLFHCDWRCGNTFLANTSFL